MSVEYLDRLDYVDPSADGVLRVPTDWIGWEPHPAASTLELAGFPELALLPVTREAPLLHQAGVWWNRRELKVSGVARWRTADGVWRPVLGALPWWTSLLGVSEIEVAWEDDRGLACVRSVPRPVGVGLYPVVLDDAQGPGSIRLRVAPDVRVHAVRIVSGRETRRMPLPVERDGAHVIEISDVRVDHVVLVEAECRAGAQGYLAALRGSGDRVGFLSVHEIHDVYRLLGAVPGERLLGTRTRSLLAEGPLRRLARRVLETTGDAHTAPDQLLVEARRDPVGLVRELADSLIE